MHITISLTELSISLSEFGFEPPQIKDIIKAVGCSTVPTESKKPPKVKHANYQQFIGAYSGYLAAKKLTMPRLEASEGKAMNSIIDTLKLQDFVQNEVHALAAWNLVLENDGILNPFLRSQMLRLTTFNKYFSEILIKLRNQNAQFTHATSEQKRDTNLGKYA